MNFIRNLFKKDQPSEMKTSSKSPKVEELLLGLPVIKQENISNYRQTIIKAESHPSMFMGSSNETAGFVAKMAEETEKYILSSEGITRVEKHFLINNYRVGEKILEIQYQQFWNNGTSSVYSEHVMRIGEDKFEVFGSESSAKRMKAVWKIDQEQPTSLIPPVQLRHDEQGFETLIEIHAGPFLMGSHKEQDPNARDTELPQHELNLPRYWIGKTPVTVAQYRAFVGASGYNWEGASKEQRGEDHPVVFVSWHDAQAYCKWLTGVWRASGQIDAGKVVQLPSEAEWEKAARGTDGRIYPWGNEEPDAQHCNFDRNVKTTTPVGMFSPQGDSPYGCVDMAGNVREWTRSLSGDLIKGRTFLYPYKASDGREDLRPGNEIFRVLRGGDFNQPAWGIRAGIPICCFPKRNGLVGNPRFSDRYCILSPSMMP